uniref:Uncharacterized protein n=1 Tax=Arundo donax TaxID=35708 RepID=A0A0A9HNA8_ARUDO
MKFLVSRLLGGLLGVTWATCSPSQAPPPQSPPRPAPAVPSPPPATTAAANYYNPDALAPSTGHPSKAGEHSGDPDSPQH